MEIKSRNTNTLMLEFIRLITDVRHVVREDSRNGPVTRFREPVTICLTHPWERVNFNPTRDGNPFFHLMEALAMLAGVNSAKLMAHFTKNMLAYSDDGETFNAFYGTRLRQYRTKRQHFPLAAVFDAQDQLEDVITVLRNDPLSRQAVAMLWDPADLPYRETKDKACNLCLVFSNDQGKLRMTSFNRSNDGIFGGVMGANIVHLSMFQEYVALALGLPIGEWWHTSNNLHVYEKNEKWPALSGLTPADYQDIYPNVDRGALKHLFTPGLPVERTVFEAELRRFFMEITSVYKTALTVDARTYQNEFLRDTAAPVFNAWQGHKSGDKIAAAQRAEGIAAPDWRVACMDWLERRFYRMEKKEVAK